MPSAPSISGRSVPDKDESAVEPFGSSNASSLVQVSSTPKDGDVEKHAGPPVDASAATTADPADPNVVDFDGPDDPTYPTNWPKREKWGAVGVLSALTFITYVARLLLARSLVPADAPASPLASSMFAPGVPQVLADFGTTDALIGSFVVSIYVLGYALGPLLIAPLSELYGRMPLYHATNLLFVVFTVACAVATSMPMLVVFRFFEGCAGSAVITMGGGSIADLFVQSERGTAMSIWSIGPLVGPVVGPVAGGFLAQAKGWRWVFWVIAIAVGCWGHVGHACNEANGSSRRPAF
jgi:multidrug resistance protein